MVRDLSDLIFLILSLKGRGLLDPASVIMAKSSFRMSFASPRQGAVGFLPEDSSAEARSSQSDSWRETSGGVLNLYLRSPIVNLIKCPDTSTRFKSGYLSIR